MALLRRVIGDALRARRQGQHRTLREVSTAANVSLGYLSEIERGEKEASSELLASICDALGSQMSEVLRDASNSLARAERSGALAGAGAEARGAGGSRGDGLGDAAVPADAPLAPAGADALAARAKLPAARLPLADGAVSVAVRHNGPLHTTLHTVRTRPGTRPGTRSVVHSG